MVDQLKNDASKYATKSDEIDQHNSEAIKKLKYRYADDT